MESLEAYVPMDRRQALALGRTLPERVQGAALFADISGFTPMTEALARDLGPQRGAEELTRLLNQVFDALITDLYHFGGSVIGFAGDAITCWLDGDSGLRATACALAMQRTMERFASVTIPSGRTFPLEMKAAVVHGMARRFTVGDPQYHVVDVLAGTTLDRLARAEHEAERGEVLIDAITLSLLGDQVELVAERVDVETGERFGVVTRLLAQIEPQPWSAVPAELLTEDRVRPWLLPPVYERLRVGQGEFLADLRPVAALFLRFGGIDYDNDEAAGTKLDSYIRWIQKVITDYEGHLLHVTMGDKGSYLSVAFGAPIAHEDDAERALSVALELKDLPAEFDFIPYVQIGISLGRVLAGAYGGTARRTYGLMGDDVILAARLMEAAAAGQILVSQSVQQAARDAFVWEHLPTIKVKGKTAPVTVFSPVRAHRRRALRVYERSYALPMVGREAELALVERKLELARQGQGQIVGITGDAGIGKTRLVTEVVRLAQERGLLEYASECQSYGTNTSYLVWRPIWRAFFDIDPAWDVADQLSALEKKLEQVDPGLVPRLPLLGPALNLSIPDNDLTISFDAKLRKESLEALLVDCLRAQAETIPLLFVLEDVHWLDALSHDLTEVIGRAITNLPVLLIMAYRPPEVPRLQAPRVSALPHFTQITLTDFTPQEAERLITLKLEQFFGLETEVPAALVERITTRAEGNPFYIEELLNYLHDRGIEPHNTQALEQLDLPTSLHSLIISRLDQRTESQKTTLRVASVVGRLFRVALLWGMYPEIGPRERVKSDLDALCALDLTRVDTPEPELTYLFKHIVTQEVAYESLPYATRAMLHEQLAQFIETSYSEPLTQYVDLLAFHYEHSENQDKKREYLLKAGGAAQADYANDAAIDYYQRVLPLLSPREQVAVMCSLGEVLTHVGRYDEALDSFASAWALVEANGSFHDGPCGLAELCRRTAVVHERRSEYSVAFEWLEKGLRYLDEQEPTIEAVQIHLLGAGVYQRQGKYDDAEEWCQRGLSIALKIETDEGRQAMARAYYSLGGIAVRRGDLQRAIEFCRESVAAYQQIGDVVGLSQAYINLANAYSDQGDWERASDALQRSLTTKQEIGDVFHLGFITNNLGNIYLYRGEWNEAAGLFDQSSAIWKQLGAALPEAVTLSNLAQVHIYQGDWSEAHTCLSRSEAIFSEIGSDDFLPELERRWGEYYLKTDAFDEALTHARRSIELAKTQEARLEEGLTSRLLGEVYLARGHKESAEIALRQSLEILSDLNSEYEAAKTMLSLVRLLMENGEEIDRAQLESAVQTFERLGAQADLAAAQALR